MRGQRRSGRTAIDVLADPAVRRLWLAQLQSSLGDWAARLALTVLIYRRTGSALLATLVLAISTVPYLLAPLGLAALRHRPHRLVLVLADLVRAALFAVMALRLPVAVLLGLLLLAALATPVFEATRTAILPTLVPPGRVPDVLALQQITTQSATVGGFLLGGVLLTAIGARPALLVNAATFALSALLITRLPAPRAGASAGPATGPGPALTTLGHLRAAMRQLRVHPLLRRAALLSVVQTPGLVIPEALVVVYAQQAHHPHLVGVLAAAPALTIALGGLIAPRHGDPRRLLRTVAVVALSGTAITAVLFAVARGPVPLVLGFLALGIPGAATVTQIAVAVAATPADQLGTVMGVVQAAIMTSITIGALAGGAIASASSAQLACLVGLVPGACYACYAALRVAGPAAGPVAGLAPAPAEPRASAAPPGG
ncbi:MAG: MFS transporter [Mycobacteriales bacterium]